MKERNSSSRLLSNQPRAQKYRIHLLLNRAKVYYLINSYPTGITSVILNDISLSGNFKEFSVYTQRLVFCLGKNKIEVTRQSELKSSSLV